MTNRISVEQVKTAVEANKIPLIRGRWIEWDFRASKKELSTEYAMSTGPMLCGACALSHVGFHKNSTLRDNVFNIQYSMPPTMREALGISSNYMDGFVCGFDSSYKEENEHPEFVMGHEDGKAVRDALLPGRAKDDQ